MTNTVPPVQPVFSRRSAPHVTDTGLVKRSLINLADNHPESTNNPDSPLAKQLANSPRRSSADHSPKGPRPLSPEQQKGYAMDEKEQNMIKHPAQYVLENQKKLLRDQIPDPAQPTDQERAERASGSLVNSQGCPPGSEHWKPDPDAGAIEKRRYSSVLVGPARDNYLDRTFLESAIATYNRLAEHARTKKAYHIAISHLRRALLLDIPPDDWPLRVLISKTQVNVATLHYLLGDHHASLLEATLARDRSLECLNYLDVEASKSEDADLLFLLEEAAVTFCLSLHSAALAMKVLPGVEPDSILEIDRLSWKIATKYLDRGHPCGKFLLKAYEARATLTPAEIRDIRDADKDDENMNQNGVSTASQFRIKKKIALRELGDLFALMKAIDGETHQVNGVKIPATEAMAKLWDDFLVCKQKAVNFELDLPQVRKLEEELIKRMAKLKIDAQADKELKKKNYGKSGHKKIDESKREADEWLMELDGESQSQAKNEQKGQKGIRKGGLRDKRNKKKVKDKELSNAAKSYLDAANVTRMKNEFRHESLLTHQYLHSADSDHLYEIRECYSKAKMRESRSKSGDRHRQVTAAPTGGGKHGHHGYSPQALGTLHELRSVQDTLLGNVMQLASDNTDDFLEIFGDESLLMDCFAELRFQENMGNAMRDGVTHARKK